jgi:hypothetical protein
MDLLPQLSARDSRVEEEQDDVVDATQPILSEPHVAIELSSGPNDELAVAEIGLAEIHPGTLFLSQSAVIGKPWPLAHGSRHRRFGRLRLQLPGTIKKPPIKAPRSAGLALLAVVVAAAVLSRTGGGSAGSVYSAGAAGALVSATDLGDTWSEGGLTFDLGAVPTAAYDPNAFAHGGCGKTAVDPTSNSVAARSSTFNNGNRFISDAIGVFPSAGVARERFTAYRSALAACRRWTATTSDGGQLALRLDPVQAEQIGEDSGVYRLEGVVTPAKSGLPQSTAIQAAVVVMRRVNVVSVVAEMSIGYLGQAADARTSDATLAASVSDAKLAKMATIRGPLQEAAGSDNADADTLAGSNVPARTSGLSVGSPHVLQSNDGGKVSANVLQVIDPANGQDGYVPKPGYRYVGVQVRLGNVGQSVYDDSPENGAILVDDRGEQHYADLAELTDGDGFGGHVTLQPEETREGFIVFQLPQNVRPATFQFALDSGFAQNMAQWTLSPDAIRPGNSPSPSAVAGSPD